MAPSPDKIRVSHAGTLPRPEGLKELLTAEPGSARAQTSLAAAVADVVRKQAAMGIDIVNDGEFSKVRGFSEYVRERLGGLAQAATKRRLSVMARDLRDFPGFVAAKFARHVDFSATSGAECIAPLTYVGTATVQTDIANLKVAMRGLAAEAYLPSIAPGTIEHWLTNKYYSKAEDFVFAIADAMSHEYKLIVDAGFLLQIDDPDLADGWQIYPDMTVAEYRRYASLRVEALNHALRDIPEEKIRLHVCWGSNHGPHKNDIPFSDIIDIFLRGHAGCYSFEFANPRHEHEWRVWEGVKLPAGKTVMPGVVGHATDIIEHPRLVADRLILFAKLVGKESVIAGTDCGLSARLSHPELTWAKLEALVEGARIASNELWAR
jgi:5-methyltetrahydropteroyltriglutamate--homocysteine methyltransferase